MLWEGYTRTRSYVLESDREKWVGVSLLNYGSPCCAKPIPCAMSPCTVKMLDQLLLVPPVNPPSVSSDMSSYTSNTTLHSNSGVYLAQYWAIVPYWTSVHQLQLAGAHVSENPSSPVPTCLYSHNWQHVPKSGAMGLYLLPSEGALIESSLSSTSGDRKEIQQRPLNKITGLDQDGNICNCTLLSITYSNRSIKF